MNYPAVKSIYVPLTHGKVAVIDLVDAWILKYNWTAVCAGVPDLWYAITNSDQSLGGPVKMHCLIMGSANGNQWDHVSGDGLDNRRANLRLATPSQNGQNRRKTRRITASRFKGVSRVRRKWQARILASGARIHLGNFLSEEDAARAYDEAALAHFGGFARTNAMLGLFNGAFNESHVVQRSVGPNGEDRPGQSNQEAIRQGFSGLVPKEGDTGERMGAEFLRGKQDKEKGEER